MSTSPERCLSPAELAQAAAGQAPACAVRHLHACASCAGDVRAERRTERLVRALPDIAVDELRLARVKAAVLAASVAPAPAVPARGSARRRVRAVVAAALVAAAASYLVLRTPPEPAAPRARIIAVASSSYTHQVAADRDELRLREGSLVIDVFPGRTLRVATDDAALYIVDATFRVTVAGDVLRSIEVYRGEVTVDGALGHHVLAPGASLPAAAAPVAPPTAPSSPAARPERDSATPRGAGRRISPAAPPAAAAVATEPAADPGPRFRRGRALLAAGELVEAAASFEASAADPAEMFLREEARFWAAVSWGRADRRRAAIAGFRDFLDRHPDSFRAAEARVALGTLLLGAGDRAGARAAFEAAAADADPGIARAARRGLAAVGDLD